MKEKSQIPPGWNYNPSTWDQRIPIIIFALIGMLIALYLGLYQLDVINNVWEPFFGSGSIIILNSKVSKILPVPDALLGAFGYFLDVLTGIVGGKRRWRTMPWIVIIFGFAVGPLGVVSILLVVLQPVMFDSWCTLCLASAVISLIMIGPAMDEVLASLQLMQRAKHYGVSRWKTFWGSKEVT